MDAFRHNSMYHGPGLINWCFLYPERDERQSMNFLRGQLMRCLRSFEIRDPQNFSYDDRSLASTLQHAANQDPQIILILLANNNAQKYATIKKFACIAHAILTQVLTLKTLQRNAMSVATKVVIQMNAKLGYAPWKIAIPLQSFMVCGFDISKEGRDIFGAFVASMDERTNPGKYFSVAEVSVNFMTNLHFS